jgi:hypothetical protein
MLQPQAHQLTSSPTVHRVNTVHLDTHWSVPPDLVRMLLSPDSHDSGNVYTTHHLSSFLVDYLTMLSEYIHSVCSRHLFMRPYSCKLQIFKDWLLIASGPRQHSDSLFRVPRDSWPYFTLWRLRGPWAASTCILSRQRQSYFTTGGLSPISSSWCQASWDSRPEFFFNWILAVIALM